MKTIVILSHVGFDNSPYCNYVHEHAKALAKQGYKVIVLALIGWIPILSTFQKRKKDFMKGMKNSNKIQIIDGVEVRYIKTLTFSNLLYNSKININGISYYNRIKNIFKKIYNEENVVLLDAHTFKIEGYAAYKLKKEFKNLTTTITLHGTSFLRNLKTENGRKSIEKILNGVDYSICVSNMMQNKAKECNVQNTKVIFNGVNLHDFQEIEKEKYGIITVGSLIKRKNHDITIKVVEKLKEKYPKIKLTIVGFGIERDKLEELVRIGKLEDNVEFKGQISNYEVLDLMNKNNIFLLPSVAEGFGIVYIEAMKAKTIAIGTKNEGIDGFIKDKVNGFLVTPNVDEIVKLIEDIYLNKYDLHKIRAEGYKDAENLTWEKNAESYIEVI